MIYFIITTATTTAAVTTFVPLMKGTFIRDSPLFMYLSFSETVLHALPCKGTPIRRLPVFLDH